MVIVSLQIPQICVISVDHETLSRSVGTRSTMDFERLSMEVSSIMDEDKCLSNNQFKGRSSSCSNFDKIYLLDDPIDLTLSLFTKLEVWNRNYHMAENVSRIGGKTVDHERDILLSGPK